ncbi:MAG: hypothetical protein IJ061_06760 [Lachnospiraceae bacterium]|nr:hypothetical protein [Lachnospiraceae bacterium]
MKKRILKSIIMILTLFSLMVPIAAQADTACIVAGTQNYLALRNAPRTDANNEIGKLYNGELFVVTSNGSNGFAYGYNALGQYGYVNASYLRVASYQPQYTQRTGVPKIVTGTTNYLALRSSAVRSSSNEIGRLHNGDVFYVTEFGSTGFAYGYTASGQYGYVVSAYLR